MVTKIISERELKLNLPIGSIITVKSIFGKKLQVKTVSKPYNEDGEYYVDYQYDTKGPVTKPKFNAHNDENATHWSASYNEQTGEWEMNEN
jgi:hypothetical protein